MSTQHAGTGVEPSGASPAVLGMGVLVWLWVVVPFCYGIYKLVERIPALFG